MHASVATQRSSLNALSSTHALLAFHTLHTEVPASSETSNIRLLSKLSSSIPALPGGNPSGLLNRHATLSRQIS